MKEGEVIFRLEAAQPKNKRDSAGR
jgi:hypothetical protein